MSVYYDPDDDYESPPLRPHGTFYVSDDEGEPRQSKTGEIVDYIASFLLYVLVGGWLMLAGAVIWRDLVKGVE